MKILITGGTGFLGSRLAGYLIKKGHTVTVFSREINPALSKFGAKFFVGDILDANSVRSAVRGNDVVYHLAAALDESDPDMYNINVFGTKNVAEACKENKAKRLILSSSIGVLGYTDAPATEEMPYNPTTLYEKSKMESEKIVLSVGVPYTIVRMTIIVGPNRFWESIFRAAEKGYPIVGSGKNYWHLLYVDDAIQALALSLDKKAENRTYNIADADPHTYEGVYYTICDVLKIPRPEKHVPVWLANFGAFMHETKCKLTGKKPKVTKMRSSIARLVRNLIVNIEKAKNELGYSPEYTLEAGIQATAKQLGKSNI